MTVTHTNHPAPKPTFTSMRQPLRCQVSGAVLGVLEVSIVEGHLPFLQNFNEMQLLHPFFGQPTGVLLRKFHESLLYFAQNGWGSNPAQMQRIQILMSATMHRLSALVQEAPSMPSEHIAAGCAHRLYHLACWYLLETSRRLELPRFAVSTVNQNMQWENFRHWLDTLAEIQERWQSKKQEIARDEELRNRDAALREVMSKHTRKVNLKNVWAWIRLQLERGDYRGELDTWEALFMTGDICPEDWLVEDIDDLAEAITDHCDLGNEIIHYVRNRMNAIRETIDSFYGSFTIVRERQLTTVSNEASEQEKQMLAEFDEQADALDELPPAPQQCTFANIGLYYRARAQWNILKARYELSQKRKNSAQNSSQNGGTSAGEQK